MKKAILNIRAFVLLAVATVLCASCIKETFPTNAVTQDQVNENRHAMEYLSNGMAVWFSEYFTVSSNHYDFGYPALCIAMDRMGQDLVDPNAGGYDWFRSWSQVSYFGPEYYYPYLFWNFYYTLGAKANIVLREANPELPGFLEDWYPAIGLAKFYRAFAYFNLVQLYQWTYLHDKTLPAVPIIDEHSGETEASNAPRASVEKVYEFILADLEDAWKYLDYDEYGYDRTTVNQIDQQVVAGLYARVYLTIGEYELAAEYARFAQDGFTPLTEDQFNNPVSGFNDIMSQNSWIWALDLTTDDGTVQSGIVNFTSFMCNEYEMGYTSVGVNAIIDAGLYGELGENDFRRNTWDDEDGDYLSHKFAPYQGDPYSELQACDFPLMRVEEMILIEAEAEGMLNPTKGAQLLTAFVSQHRDPDYVCNAASTEELQDAVWIQRRLELWGEGFGMFDIKRLQKGVTRLYEGSNHPSQYQWNFTVTPGYMNLCIPRTEIQNNDGISQEENNPTPSQPKSGQTYTTPYV